LKTGKFSAKLTDKMLRSAIQEARRVRRRRAISRGPRRRIMPARLRGREAASAFAHEGQRPVLPIVIRCIDAFIDCRDLLNPSPPFAVLEIEHVVVRPVKVVGEKGYLLI
jgi:hypothetical protein